ncbi:transporter-like protein [Hapsidospora chrysogenum ATCC 11550]|uniref:Transporter-like protein n=1 Tax=Hapsidospora chrysogenum (strain ATCC 11550 / CBS 779.69 / DSM 880 / IAM 14645 / JCM 23072 / IMI 49137) TaxID=857340 RepID=A0A086TFV3_HAPC1|nr:transporter-like protein [Hapsidospora chrysogenum ATCC 11550]
MAHVAPDRPENYSSFQSWLAVLGASLALFSTVGFMNAFGVFQERFRTLLHGSSDSDISWIGSTAMALMSLLSPVAGVIVDKYGPRIPICIGTITQLLAIFLASLAKEYYQILLSQGVLFGISMALVTNPSLAVVSRRLPHRRGAAFGLTIGGSSVGGITWPIMLLQLLYRRDIGYGWTMRAVGFVMMVPLAIACLTVTSPPTVSAETTPLENKDGAPRGGESNSVDEKDRPNKIDFSILKNGAFLFLCLGLSLTYLGLVVPLFYLSAYAVERGTSADAAFYLLSGLNAASFFGRVLPGILADKWGHFNTLITMTVLSSVVAFSWTAAESLGGLVVLFLAYGFASGGVMSLQLACAGKLGNKRNQGAVMGCVMGSCAVTGLVGSPIAGRILGASSYLGLSMWTGATLLSGAAAVAAARLKANKKLLAAM